MTRVRLIGNAVGITVLLGTTWVVPTARGQGGPPGFVRATATLSSCTDKTPVGTATFVEPATPEGVKNVAVQVSVRNLTPGAHAVVIRDVGECDPCSAAGNHLDLGPFGHNVPVTTNHPYHSGDLINVNVGPRGTGFMSHVTSRLALSEGNLSIFDADGASLVVHALPDTYCPDPTDPNCAGGARVACGIIRRVQ